VHAAHPFMESLPRPAEADATDAGGATLVTHRPGTTATVAPLPRSGS
jgi:hypothetical protein